MNDVFESGIFCTKNKEIGNGLSACKGYGEQSVEVTGGGEGGSISR
jgi:hypothetical protein